MDSLLQGLKAAAEPTRLRIMALCAHGELSVSDLTQILGQSQPRVSRHLKLLCDAGLLDRFREGTYAFFRMAGQGPMADLARALVDQIPVDDGQLTLDLERLEAIRRHRAEQAAAYFRENAERWDDLRTLYIPETEVERAILAVLQDRDFDSVIDLGTGTGRVLSVVADRARRAVGIDASREMLSVARSNLERAGLRHAQVRLGNLYQLPVPNAAFDVAVMHQVLHYLEDPAEALSEAARVVKPGGVLLIADFQPHDHAHLRDEHAHRWLGFADAQVRSWLTAAGFAPGPVTTLEGGPITVGLWQAERRADRAGATITSIADRRAVKDAL